MIKIDTSEISNAQCFIINTNNTITSYNYNNLKVYNLYGNKYYKTQDYNNLYNTIPSNYRCYSLEEIRKLPSNFDFIEPIYHFIAILSVLFIVFSAYKLIIHPWWRKRV